MHGHAYSFYRISVWQCKWWHQTLPTNSLWMLFFARSHVTKVLAKPWYHHIKQHDKILEASPFFGLQGDQFQFEYQICCDAKPWKFLFGGSCKTNIRRDNHYQSSKGYRELFWHKIFGTTMGATVLERIITQMFPRLAWPPDRNHIFNVGCLHNTSKPKPHFDSYIWAGQPHMWL